MKINIQTLLCNWNNKLIFCLSGLLAFIFSISNSASASEPKPWQMDLQPPAGIIAENATDLHNFLLVVITLISVFVLGLLIYVCIKYREQPGVKP